MWIYTVSLMRVTSGYDQFSSGGDQSTAVCIPPLTSSRPSVYACYVLKPHPCVEALIRDRV